MRILLAVFLFFLTICVRGQGYLIGAGDLLEIRFYEQEDLTTIARVSTEGDIRIPLVGTVSVAGMTEREAEADIARQFQVGGLVQAPQVTVVIMDHVSNMVSVLGEVTASGRYSLDSGDSVADVIALASGTTESANDRVIVVSGDTRTHIDLDAALRGDEGDMPLKLKAGDVVYVPRMDIFYIYGEAREPGAYRLEKGMNVMQALAVGGSLTESGSENRIMIRRIDEETGQAVSFDAELTDLIQANDVIHVRERIF